MPIQAYISNLFAPSRKPEEPSPRATAGTGRESLHFVEPRAFVRHVAAQGGQLTEDEIWRANLNLLGLEELRRRMGTRWPKLATRIHIAAERIIDTLIPDGGVFTRSRDGQFALLLPVGCSTDAETICETISRKIELYCLGEPELEDIRVEHRLLASGEDDMADMIGAEEAERSPEHEPPSSNVFNPGVEELRRELSMPSFRLPGQPAAMRRKFSSTTTRANQRYFGYQPILDTRKEAVWAFRQVEIEADYSEKTESFSMSGPADLLEKQRLERDIQAARLTGSFAQSWPEHCSSAVVIATVGIETLSVRHYRNAYLSALMELPVRIRNRLVIEIIGSPAGTPSGKITECASYARPHVRGLWLRVPGFRSIPTNLTGSSICGVGVHLADTGAQDSNTATEVGKFVEMAESQRMNAYIFGVDKGATAAACCESNLRFLAGEAIGQAKAAPGRAYKAARPASNAAKCTYAHV